MNDNRILIVSRDISLKKDGGTLVSKRNERLLHQLGFRTSRFIVPIPSLTTRFANIIFRQSYGSTRSLLNSFYNTLNHNYHYIFFDGSIYGGYLKIASQLGHKTICFYHNCETEYYRQKAEQTKNFADKLMVPFIKYNEKLSTLYSNGIITLNSRDSDLLSSIYGRKADAIIPTSFPNKDIKALYSNRDNKTSEEYLLFVGTNFFANNEGLTRFIRNIAPNIKWKIKVIGNINEAFHSLKNIPPNVEFIGRVDNLEKYYIDAAAVIAPIFTGSGLKTKTAEAISYGKTIIGFPEAFEGIDYKNYPGSCISVATDSEFIEQLNIINTNKRYNIMSDRLFHDKLSDESQIESLSLIFEKLK